MVQDIGFNETNRKKHRTETQKWAIVSLYNYYCNPENGHLIKGSMKIL